MQLPGYYEFYCRVKTVAGHDVLERIPDMLKGLSAEAPLIITDKGVSATGLTDIVTKAIADGVSIKGIEDGSIKGTH